MRLLYLHYGVHEGGDANGWSRTFNLAMELSKSEGVDVTLLTTSPRKARVTPELRLVGRLKILVFPELFGTRITRGGFSIYATVLKFLFVLRSPKFDAVIADNIHRPACLIPALACRLSSSKIFSEWWELFSGQGINSDASLLHRMTVGFYDEIAEVNVRKWLCDGVFAISSFLKNELVNSGYDAHRVEVLNAGVDEKILKYRNNIDRRRSKTTIIGLIGANREELASNEMALKIFEKYRAQGFDIKVLCSGKSFSDPLVERYSQLLVFTGWLDYESFLYQMSKCDAYLLIQNDTVRNRARFPNKLGDYLGFGGKILSNGIGDVAAFHDLFPEVFVTVDTDQDIVDFLNGCCSERLNAMARAEDLSDHFWRARALKMLRAVTHAR